MRFFFWRAAEWTAQVGRRDLEAGAQREGETLAGYARRQAAGAMQAEGETAYALRQAEVQMRLAEVCAEEWEGLPALIARGRAGELEQADTAGRAGRVGDVVDDDDDDEDGSDDDERDNRSDGEEEEPVPTLSGAAINPTYVDEVLAM